MKHDISGIVGSSLWADIVDVWEKAGKTASIITLPTLSVAAVFNKLMEPVLSFWEVIVLSWPLVISATIIALLFWRGDIGNKSGFVGSFYILVALLFPYAIANIAGVEGPLPNLPEASSGSSPFNIIPNTIVQIVYYYFGAYGLSRTFSGVICGVFLAWVFHKKLLPRVRALQPAAVAPNPPPPPTD
jgi:hypothetical protein